MEIKLFLVLMWLMLFGFELQFHRVIALKGDKTTSKTTLSRAEMKGAKVMSMRNSKYSLVEKEDVNKHVVTVRPSAYGGGADPDSSYGSGYGGGYGGGRGGNGFGSGGGGGGGGGGLGGGCDNCGGSGGGGFGGGGGSGMGNGGHGYGGGGGGGGYGPGYGGSGPGKHHATESTRDAIVSENIGRH